MNDIIPTKSNFINLQKSLNLSQKGFELLDKKRNILIKEIIEYIDRAKGLQENIMMSFKEGYDMLKKANITMGEAIVKNIAITIPESTDYNIVFKSVMGVEIPYIDYIRKDIKTTYSFSGSNINVDLTYKKFNEIKYLIYEFAEIENAVYRLAIELKKTQKRANILENIQIPKFKKSLKFIQEVLEEKDREDFFRLKKIKKINSK